MPPKSLAVTSPTQRQANPAVDAAIAALVGVGSIRAQQFVRHHLRLIAEGRENAAEACRLAGYAVRHAKQQARKLQRQPAVRAAIDAVRAANATAAAEETVYSQAQCVIEINGYLPRAAEAGQWSAVANLVNTKARVTGVLVDRIDARVAVGSFQIIVEPWAPPATPPALAGTTGE